jgi:hypothetical protein
MQSAGNSADRNSTTTQMSPRCGKWPDDVAWNSAATNPGTPGAPAVPLSLMSCTSTHCASSMAGTVCSRKHVRQTVDPREGCARNVGDSGSPLSSRWPRMSVARASRSGPHSSSRKFSQNSGSQNSAYAVGLLNSLCTSLLPAPLLGLAAPLAVAAAAGTDEAAAPLPAGAATSHASRWARKRSCSASLRLRFSSAEMFSATAMRAMSGGGERARARTSRGRRSGGGLVSGTARGAHFPLRPLEFARLVRVRRRRRLRAHGGGR